MVPQKPLVMVMLACAFGACHDNEPQQQEPPLPCDPPASGSSSSCVCRPTLKLDVSSMEPPRDVCNNATFDWMLHTMLAEMSALRANLAETAVRATQHQEVAEQLEDQVKALEQENQELRNNLDEDRIRIGQLLDKVDQQQAEINKLQVLRGELDECQANTGTLVAEKEQLQLQSKQLEAENEEVRMQLIEQNKRRRPADCADLHKDGFRHSGVFTVYPTAGGDTGMEVFCDMTTDGGGWTVVQRRQDGSQSFHQDWKTYKSGFGQVWREFWLGNDALFRFTHQKDYTLRVDMTDIEGATGFAAYSEFFIDNEESGYILHVGNYSGTVGDSMTHHNLAPFSAVDVDRDQSRSGHCSKLYGNGGWWYVRCYDCNLNGQYGVNNKSGIIWFHWHETHRSLRHVEMKIRPHDFKQQ